jgi:cytidine deaminase
MQDVPPQTVPPQTLHEESTPESDRTGPSADALVAAARQAADNAYAPYSGWHVGAAAVFAEAPHEVFRGCNVENSSYGLTLCAERAALVTAATAGRRRLVRIALTCRDQNGTLVAKVAPCGACLQVIAEFGTADTEIVIDGRGSFQLRDFLPLPFGAESLKRDAGGA